MCSESLTLAGGEEAILFVHGLASTPLELKYLAAKAHEAGYSAYVPYFKTFGYTQDRDHFNAMLWQDWYEEVRNVYLGLTKKHSKVHLCGLCAGGNLSLEIAAQNHEAVTGCTVILSPTIYYDGWGVYWISFLFPLVDALGSLKKKFSYKETHPYGVKNETLRKVIQRAMKKDKVSASGGHEIPFHGISQERKLIKANKESIKKITSPLLIIHSLYDETTSIKSAQYIEQGTKHVVSRVTLKDSYHMISIDNEKEVVAKEMLIFIKNH